MYLIRFGDSSGSDLHTDTEDIAIGKKKPKVHNQPPQNVHGFGRNVVRTFKRIGGRSNAQC